MYFPASIFIRNQKIKMYIDVGFSYVYLFIFFNQIRSPINIFYLAMYTLHGNINRAHVGGMVLKCHLTLAQYRRQSIALRF